MVEVVTKSKEANEVKDAEVGVDMPEDEVTMKVLLDTREYVVL